MPAPQGAASRAAAAGGAAPARQAWRRRALPALVVLLVLVAVLAIAFHHLTRPENLAARLVSLVRTQLGADLVLAGAPHLAFLPEPTLQMPAFQLRQPGAAGAMLQAGAASARAPWNLLRPGGSGIAAIRLSRPVVDLDALRGWLQARPAAEGTPALPAFTLSIVDGTVVAGGEVVAQGIEVELAGSDTLSPWLQQLREGGSPELPPLAGRIGVESVDHGNVRLEGVRIHLDPPTTQESAR